MFFALSSHAAIIKCGGLGLRVRFMVSFGVMGRINKLL